LFPSGSARIILANRPLIKFGQASVDNGVLETPENTPEMLPKIIGRDPAQFNELYGDLLGKPKDDLIILLHGTPFPESSKQKSLCHWKEGL
jgi:hypothetical protein